MFCIVCRHLTVCAYADMHVHTHTHTSTCSKDCAHSRFETCVPSQILRQRRPQEHQRVLYAEKSRCSKASRCGTPCAFWLATGSFNTRLRCLKIRALVGIPFKRRQGARRQGPERKGPNFTNQLLYGWESSLASRSLLWMWTLLRSRRRRDVRVCKS